jgi:hypothetical protein
MKIIEPVSNYDSDEGYPCVDEGGVNRRSFLRAAFVGTATVGGSLLLGGEAASRKRSTYHRVTFRLRGHYRYYPCRYRADSLLVQTRSSRFARFLANTKEQARTEKVLAKLLRAAKCTDVQDAKNLAKLHRKLAQALAIHYTKRTGRPVKRPVVTLSLRRIRHIPVPGGIRPPHRPTP